MCDNVTFGTVHTTIRKGSLKQSCTIQYWEELIISNSVPPDGCNQSKPPSGSISYRAFILQIDKVKLYSPKDRGPYNSWTRTTENSC